MGDKVSVGSGPISDHVKAELAIQGTVWRGVKKMPEKKPVGRYVHVFLGTEVPFDFSGWRRAVFVVGAIQSSAGQEWAEIGVPRVVADQKEEFSYLGFARKSAGATAKSCKGMRIRVIEMKI